MLNPATPSRLSNPMMLHHPLLSELEGPNHVKENSTQILICIGTMIEDPRYGNLYSNYPVTPAVRLLGSYRQVLELEVS